MNNIKSSEKVRNKGNKKMLRCVIFIISLTIMLTMVVGITVINYKIHSDVNNGKFKAQASISPVLSYIKPLIINGEFTLTEDELNGIAKYEIQSGQNQKNQKYTVNDVYVDIKENSQADIYIKYSAGSVKILKITANTAYSPEKQKIILKIKNVLLGSLDVPDFLISNVLGKIPYSQTAVINANTIEIPLSLSSESYSLKINSVSFAENSITVKTDLPFKKERELLYNIFGEKTNTILENILDTVISSFDGNTPTELINNCLDALYKKFCD